MTELERVRIDLANRVADKVLEEACGGPGKSLEWPGTTAVFRAAKTALEEYERLVRAAEHNATVHAVGEDSHERTEPSPEVRK